MFELRQQHAKVSYLNVRPEKHGEDPVVACDIGLVTDQSADILDEIAKGLKAALYVKPKAPTQSELAEGAPPVEEGPQLRFDGVLGPLKLQKEYAGYGLRLTWGDIASTVMVKLDDVKACKLKAEAKQGGTVELRCQIQARPGEGQMDQLCLLMDRDVTVDLVAPGREYDEPATP